MGLETPPRLWIGLVGVAFLPGCAAFADAPRARGAYVYLLAMAHSADDLRATAREVAARHAMRVHDISEVMPWDAWRKAGPDVEDYLHERAVDTAMDGQPRFGTFHLYLTD